MSKSNSFVAMNAPKVILNSKILPCPSATKNNQLVISGRLLQQINELSGASSISAQHAQLRFFLHVGKKSSVAKVQQVQQRAVCIDSSRSAPSVGTHEQPYIQPESHPTRTIGSLALTVPDPNNALVSALFTVQQKFNIFTVGDTVIDIGCLPGTSSRCFRSWIDQDEDHSGSGEALGNAYSSGNHINANKPSCTTESSRGDDVCRRSSYQQRSVAEIIDDAIEGRITEDESPHWRSLMLKRQKRLKERQKGTKAKQITDELQKASGRQLGSKETKTGPKDFATVTKKPPSKGIIVGIDAFQRKPASNSKSFFLGDVLVNKTVQELGMDPHLLENLSSKILKLAVHRQRELTGDDGKADVVFVDLCPMLEKELSDAANQLAVVHRVLSDQCGTEPSLSSDLESTIQHQLSPFHPLRHPQYYTRLSLPMLMENKIAHEITNARRRMRKQQSLELAAENDEGRLRLLGSGSATEYAEASFEVLSPKNKMRATNNSKNIHSPSVSSGESRFFDVSDNSTPFETFLDHVDALCGDKGNPVNATSLGRVRTAVSSSFNAVARKAQNKYTVELSTSSADDDRSGDRKGMAKSILGDADAIVVKRGGGEVFVVRDDTSGFGQGSITGVSDRINFYDYPEILDQPPDGSALSCFRPTPLSADSLFLTSLESTAAAVRMIKPYLKPFREIDLKEINASTCSAERTSHEVKTRRSSSLSSASSLAAGTSGKLLIRLVMPSEAQLMEGSETGNNASNSLQRSTNSVIRSSETRQSDHTVANSLGSISASYHAFIESLRAHFSRVEVVDKRHIREDQSNCSTSTLSVFTSFTQLLILAHNSNSPLVASELANSPRALKDNPAFILFDRELIIKSEESGGLNYINENAQTSNGNRHSRAHELKHDLPAAGIVLPSGDGLGNKKDSYSATSNSHTPVAPSATHGRKKKFRGVFKHLSQTSRTSINFNPDRDRLKVRHTRWSPNRGFSSAPHSAPNANSIMSLRNALVPNAAKAGSVGVKSIDTFDRFSTLSSLSANVLRPANLQVLTQNVIDASTTTFAASTSIKSNALEGTTQNNNNRVLSLNTGSVVKSSASSVSGSGFSQRSVNGRRSRFFMSRYPGLLQAPPPAEELSLRMKKSVAEEIRREAAQERFNQFKMESIDNYHMHKVVGEDR